MMMMIIRDHRFTALHVKGTDVLYIYRRWALLVSLASLPTPKEKMNFRIHVLVGLKLAFGFGISMETQTIQEKADNWTRLYFKNY